MQNYFLIKSIQRKKYKNISLAVLMAVLTFLIIGGSLFILVLSNGIKGMEKRLGADIMIIPADCEKTAESVLMEGSREYFYFDRSVADRIKDLDGIEALTEQFYLASLSADCCTSQVGIVGFDPETDFIIQPWIAEGDKGKMGRGKAVAGSEIQLEKDNTIKIFGRKYPVISRLAETGTSLDTSVYFTMDTVPQLIEDAQSKGIQFIDSQKDENSISSVFIKMEEGTTERELAREIKKVEDTDVDLLYPENIFKAFSENTRYIISSAYMILIAVWLVAELILLLVCHISSSGRKKEYALLRVLGISKKQLTGVLIKEILLIMLAGFAVGGLLSGITVFPFGRYLANGLKIAYLAPTALETAGIFLIGAAVSVLSGIIASVIPVIRISRLEAYSALREEE